MANRGPQSNRFLPLAIALALGLAPTYGCSDAESQKILSEASSKSPFAAKAPPEPAPPVAKAAAPAANAAAPADNAAAPANNAAAQPAAAQPAAAQPADPDAGPADAPAAPPAANPVVAPPANNPPAAAAPAEGGGGFFSNLAKGVSDRLKKPEGDNAKAQPPSGDPANTVKAGVGVGKKGRGYGGGIIAAAVHGKFSAEERIIFEARIPNAMQLFKATNDEAPRTHEQFMKEIIEANEIKLPELPFGDKYIYDPKTEQLMVEQAQ